jgi:tetratricopeptide (TPR) repeat protein
MGTGRVTGIITDLEGNPIPDAHVLATTEGSGHKIEATTDEDGEFAMMGFRGGGWTFTVTAEGYVTQADTLSVKGISKNPPITITLEKLRKGVTRSEGARDLLTEANELYHQENYDQALAKYVEILEENPGLYQIHANVGNVYKRQGKLEEALAEYQLVLDEDPSHGVASVNIGDVLVKQGKFDEAIPYFEQALESSPDDETLPFNVGELCFSNGQIEKAIVFFQKAAEIKPDWPEPYLKAGYAYLNLGKLDEAAVQLKKLIEVAPDSQEAQQAQAVLDQLGK